MVGNVSGWKLDTCRKGARFPSFWEGRFYSAAGVLFFVGCREIQVCLTPEFCSRLGHGAGLTFRLPCKIRTKSFPTPQEGSHLLLGGVSPRPSRLHVDAGPGFSRLRLLAGHQQETRSSFVCLIHPLILREFVALYEVFFPWMASFRTIASLALKIVAVGSVRRGGARNHCATLL